MKLLSFEWKRWRRTRLGMAVLLAFAFSALTGPLFAAYGEVIVESLQGAEAVEVGFAPPSWRTGLSSYLRTVAQIALLVCCAAGATACALRPRPLEHFYRTRARSKGALFAPRIVAGATVAAAGVLLGGLIAAYEVALLFDDVPWATVVSAIALQGVGVVTLGCASALATVITGSPLGSAAVVYVATFVGGIVGAGSGPLSWTPLALLDPLDLVEAGGLGRIVAPIGGSLILLAALSAVALRGGLRRPGGIVDARRWPAGPNQPARPSIDPAAPTDQRRRSRRVLTTSLRSP